MFVIIIGIFTICLALLYLGLILIYLHHWRRISHTKLPDTFIPSVTISVIIPIRNEADKIGVLLKTILANHYPSRLLEIIVINDHSTDDSLEVIKSIDAKNITVLSLEDFELPDTFNSFKKFGIEQANKIAKGELIVTTDGDCLVPPHWLEYFAYVYEIKEKSFIAGPVNFISGTKALVNFQALDFMGMMLVTGANTRRKSSMICNGANLGYSKSLFKKVGGYRDIALQASGDDIMLMNKVAERFQDQIYFIKNKNATVSTAAAPDWNAFVQQRLRWATKNSKSQDWFLKLELAIVYLLCISILVIPILFIMGWSHLTFVWIFIVIVKFIADWLLLSAATQFFGKKSLLYYLLSSFYIHTFYIAFIGSLSFFKRRFVWKGRKVY